MGTTSSPRISFSLDLAGVPPPVIVEGHKICDPDFEFLSGGGDAGAGMAAMLTADELFFEGQLLPFWQAQGIQKLEKMTLSTAKDEHDRDHDQGGGKAMDGDDHEVGRRPVSWFVDDDPSPRPPKCTVLWKELLRLRKQQPTSTAAAQGSLVGATCGKGVKSEACGDDQKQQQQQHAKRVKKGLERTRSASVRLRPVVHVPICSTQGKSNALPMLFALKRE